MEAAVAEMVLVGLVDRNGNPGVYLLAEDGLLIIATAPPGIMDGPIDKTTWDGIMSLATRSMDAGQWRDGGEASGSALSSGWPTERASLLSMRYFSNGWWGRDLNLMEVSSTALDRYRASRPPPKREAEVSVVLTISRPTGFISVRYAGTLEPRAPQAARDAWENKEIFMATPKAMGEAAQDFVLNPSPADGLTADPNWMRLTSYTAEALRGAASISTDLSAWKSSRPRGTDVVVEFVLGRVPLSLLPPRRSA